MTTTRPSRLRAVGTPRDDDVESRTARWLPWVMVALGLLAVAAAIWFTRVTTDRVDSAEVALSNTAQQASNLADQINGECAAGRLQGPVCTQAATVAAQPIPGPPGTPGANGIPGVAGVPGPAGPMGPAGRDGEPPPCLAMPPQCVGPPGEDGINGVDGKDGVDGQDGQNGQNGADGAPGRDGSPAESMTGHMPDGSTTSCVRRPTSPATAPEYDCTVIPPEAPP